MSIHILYGPGGSGKSFYQVRLIVEQLRSTKRNVVTNLALDVPRLAAYLEKQYPAESLRVGERVRILNVEETREFWKHRGPFRWIPGADYELEADPGANGVCFVIDEAGAAGFSALEWASSTGRTTRGVEAIAYLDQQRKFGDDVFASTNGRAPTGIAKGFRDKAHAFIKLRNGYLQTFGFLKARGRFEARWYQVEPTNGTEAYKTEFWKLDVTGLASCYRTQDGVGVVGSSADIGARAKGISIMWAVPAAFLLAGATAFIPWLLGKGAGAYVAGTAPVKAVVSPPAPSPASQLPSKRGELPFDGGPAAPSPARKSGLLSDSHAAPAELYATGSVAGRGRVRVQMSDGSVLTEATPGLTQVEPNFIVVSGKRIPVRPRPAPPVVVRPVDEGLGVKVETASPGSVARR